MKRTYFYIIPAHPKSQPIRRGSNIHQPTLINIPKTPAHSKLPRVPMTRHPLQIARPLIVIVYRVEGVQMVGERERESGLKTEGNTRPVELAVRLLDLEEGI
jgi:hypothetical protein